MSAAGITRHPYTADMKPMNPAEDGLPKPQRYWAILTLMAGLAMSCLDTAIVNVALPVIAKDLHTSAARVKYCNTPAKTSHKKKSSNAS